LDIFKHIVFKEEDIIKLIFILITYGDVSRFKVDYELPDQFKAYSFCSKLPIYRKITSIIINNKNSFKIKYKSFNVQIIPNLIFHWTMFLFKSYINIFSIIQFQEVCVDLTKEIIDKDMNILLNMIPIISISKTVKNLLTSKMKEVFKCFLEKFKMTFSQLEYIIWMMTELNKKLPSINYLQDITTYTILPYLYANFIISFKYMFDKDISIKWFSHYINPFLEQLVANELTVLKVLGFNLYMSEECFNVYKSKLI
jgi:hypothetical protein